MIHTREAVEVIDVPLRPGPNPVPEVEILDLDTFLGRAGHIARLPHRIDFYQILLIVQGHGRHWIDFEPHPYQPGSLFLVEKGQIQTYFLSPNTSGYLILFTEDYLYQSAGDLKWMFGLALFNSQLSPGGLTLPPSICAEFLTLINYMQTELAAPPDLIRTDIVRNLLKVLLLKAEQVKRSQGQLAAQDLPQDYDLFIRFREMLETDYASSRGVQEYAAALAISPKKLNKITHLYLGKATKQVIDERVVLEIKRLLAYSDLNMQEIAYLLGFSDPTNMTKFFKRYTCLSPAQFKTSLKKAQIDQIQTVNHL